jgi:hypothetical protein
MNTTFHRLAESTVKSGLLQLNPDLAQEFRVVKETFSGLAKAATETQRQVDEDGEQGAEGTGPPKPSEPEPEPEPQHIGWGYSAVAQLPDKVCRAHDERSRVRNHLPLVVTWLTWRLGSFATELLDTRELLFTLQHNREPIGSQHYQPP